MKTKMKWLISLMASAALLLSACSDEETPPPPTPADILVGSYTGTLTIGEQTYPNVTVTVAKKDSVVEISAGTQPFDAMNLDIIFITQDLTAVDGAVLVGITQSMVEGTAFNVAPNQEIPIGSLGKLIINGGVPYGTVNGTPYHGVGGKVTVFGITANKLSVSLASVIEINGQDPRPEPITLKDLTKK